MKLNMITATVAIFILGGLIGHALTLPSPVKADATIAQVSPLELTMKASDLPIESFDAI